MKEEISIIIKQTGVDELVATEQYNIDNNTVNSIIRILKKNNNTLNNAQDNVKNDISNDLINNDPSDIEFINQKKIKELREILNEKDKLLNAYKN